MKIVAIDDSIIICTLFKRFFIEEEGFELSVFQNPVEAYEFIKKYDGEFDAVISDIVMPDMGGLELLEKLKSQWPLLPVIMLTSQDDKGTIKNALKMGADDFIEKPFDKAALMKSIDDIGEKSVRKKFKEAVNTENDVKQAQQMLMKPPCNLKCNDFQFRFRSYKAAGGDYFSCRNFDEEKCGILLADVSGHDVKSSYLVAEFKGLLNSVWNDNQDPLKLCRILNEKLLISNNTGNFICVTALLWDRKKKILRLANAGNPHGIRLYAKGFYEWIPLNGTMLGVFANPALESKTILTETGDRFLFFSDGVSEQFGEEPVAELWKSLCHLTLREALDEMMRYFEKNSQKIHDDILIVGLEQK